MKLSPSTMLMVPWATVLTTVSLTARQSLLPDSTTGALETITLLDVSDAVKRSGAVDFDKILMLRDDEGKWALYLKPENEKAFSVYPDKADVNLFFTTVKQGDEELSDTMRQDMAQKYYMESFQ